MLWAPDVYLLVGGQPARDVAVPMVLHMAVAVVTYHVLVRPAPPRRRSEAEFADESEGASVAPIGRRAEFLALLVAAEFALGVATLVVVPTGRPTGWWPERGTVLYLVHALVGFPLALLAASYLVRVVGSTRLLRLSGWLGGAGVATAGAGGLIAVAHPLRLLGMALMLAGPVVAGFGYLIPALDRLTDDAGVGDRGDAG